MRRWALRSGAELPGLDESGEDLKWAAYSPQGDRLAASCAGSPAVSVWTLRDRGRILIPGTSGVASPPTSLVFSPDGKTLAVGGLWGIRFERLSGELDDRMRGHEEYANGPLRYTPDGRQMCALIQHRKLLCWDLYSGQWLHAWSAYPSAEGILEVSDAGDRVIWVDRDGLRIERIPRVLGEDLDRHAVVSVSFSAEGQVLTADNRGSVRYWDPATQKEVRSIQIPSHSIRSFGRNGRWAITGGGEEAVGIWDLLAAKELVSVSSAPLVTSIAVSPDGAMLALGHADGALSLWSLGERKERARLRLDLMSVTAVCWSADGTSMAWGDNLGVVVIAEGSSGREAVRFMPRGRGAILSLHFEPDGKVLIAENSAGACFAYEGTVEKEPIQIEKASSPRFRDGRVDRRWIASGFRQSWHRPAIFSGDGRYAITMLGGEAMIWEAPGAE